MPQHPISKDFGYRLRQFSITGTEEPKYFGKVENLFSWRIQALASSIAGANFSNLEPNERTVS